MCMSISAYIWRTTTLLHPTKVHLCTVVGSSLCIVADKVGGLGLLETNVRNLATDQKYAESQTGSNPVMKCWKGYSLGG